MKKQDYTAAGASYIIKFYEDVGQLTYWYSRYQTDLLQLEAQTGGEDTEEANAALVNMGDELKNALLNTIVQLRHHANTSYIAYCSLVKKLNTETKTDELKKLYDKINKEYIIKQTDALEFVQKLNEFMLNEILQDLLQSSQTLVNQIYGSTGTTQD